MANETEKKTRKNRIDTKLKKLGWQIVPFSSTLKTSQLQAHAVEEFPTASGPADYVLFVEGKLLGVVEAKKVTVGAQNVLEQAKRYSKTVAQGSGNWNGYAVPFLFSSNGEQVHFIDVREVQNLSRSIADFYSPSGLSELYHRQFGKAVEWFEQHPVEHPRLSNNARIVRECATYFNGLFLKN